MELNKKARTGEARSRPCSAGVRLDWTMSEEGLTVSKTGRYPRGQKIVYQIRVATGPEYSWSRTLVPRVTAPRDTPSRDVLQHGHISSYISHNIK